MAVRGLRAMGNCQKGNNQSPLLTWTTRMLIWFKNYMDPSTNSLLQQCGSLTDLQIPQSRQYNTKGGNFKNVTSDSPCVEDSRSHVLLPVVRLCYPLPLFLVLGTSLACTPLKYSKQWENNIRHGKQREPRVMFYGTENFFPWKVYKMQKNSSLSKHFLGDQYVLCYIRWILIILASHSQHSKVSGLWH